MLFDILSLPADVMIEIFKNMGWRDILRASLTCRGFFEIAQERSIWLHLLYDESSTLLHGPIVYPSDDLKTMILRNISGTIRWNSPQKPHERTTPDGDFPIGDAGKVLLEGGRWLLTFGQNLTRYNPEYHGAVLAYDLDSPRFASTIIYKNENLQNGMLPTGIFAHVDRSKNCPTFTVGLVYTEHSETSKRLDILEVKQRGLGPEAQLDVSIINSLTCPDVYINPVGDHVLMTYSEVGDGELYEKVQIINWRASSSTSHLISTFTLRTTYGIKLATKNRLFSLEDCKEIALYEIPEFRWTSPSDVTLADGDLQEPIWTASLSPRGGNSSVTSSVPSYGPSATRLALIQDDRIYGLIIPHNGDTPVLRLLAVAPELPTLGYYTNVTLTLFVDKIYVEPRIMRSHKPRSMLAFSWPEEADLALPTSTAWVPPILHFTQRQFAGHHSSFLRGYDLVDEVSGRIVTGSKYEHPEVPGDEDDGVEWSDIIPWSVVDFCHPQFLPSYLESS